uniref:Ig-like domain-containing protein n=1 Tax=Monodelphis domestica TaxID=13616 RepID=A0A5F8H3E6_MONDO
KGIGLELSLDWASEDGGKGRSPTLALQDPGPPSLLHPEGFQEVSRLFHCKVCAARDCNLPLECPIQDLLVPVGGQAIFSCSVPFPIPSELTYTWLFAGNVSVPECNWWGGIAGPISNPDLSHPASSFLSPPFEILIPNKGSLFASSHTILHTLPSVLHLTSIYLYTPIPTLSSLHYFLSCAPPSPSLPLIHSLHLSIPPTFHSPSPILDPSFIRSSPLIFLPPSPLSLHPLFPPSVSLTFLPAFPRSPPPPSMPLPGFLPLVSPTFCFSVVLGLSGSPHGSPSSLPTLRFGPGTSPTFGRCLEHGACLRGSGPFGPHTAGLSAACLPTTSNPWPGCSFT